MLLSVLLDSSSSEEDNIDTLRRRELRDESNPLDMTTAMFLCNFRVTKEAFMDILEAVNGILQSTSIPNILKLATALRFCAQGTYELQKENGNLPALSRNTLLPIMKETFTALEQKICAKWVKFKYTEEQKQEVKRNFYNKSGIPGCIGAIGAMHIRIMVPRKNPQHLYLNKKGFHSLNAMLVCDHKMMIRFISAKSPGATDDLMVFKLSALYKNLETEYSDGSSQSWLLGDSAYPLKPYLLTPFRNAQEGSRKSKFNKKHAVALSIMDRTMRLLKNRFRCLNNVLHFSPEYATKIANVCAALHNICNSYNVPLDEDEFTEDSAENEDVGELESETNKARSIRNGILQFIY